MRKTDYNLLRFHGDAATTAVDDAASNYQSPSIIAAGANAHTVSILTMLINLSLAMVCFKAPTLIEKAGLAKRGGMILAFLNLLAWVPLALAFFLSRLGITPGWYALLWFINVVPSLLLSFQRDNWLSNIVPHGTLGRYLGQRLAIKSAFYLGAFILLGLLLDSSGKDDLAGFAIIFTIAVGVALVDFIIFTFMSDKKTEATNPSKPETVKFSLPEYFGELKEKKLDTFILFTTFFYLTVGLSSPLYAVYMLNELHFSYLSYTLVIAAEFLARVISAPFWGRSADKLGNIRVLSIVSRIIPLIPVCWLFCHSLGYLIFIQILSGACWGAFDLCTQSYLFKVAPKPKKLRYIVYTRFLILLCTAAGGLLGSIFIDNIFPTFGSKILSVFLLSGIARIVIVMYLMPKLVDLAISYSQPPSPPEVDLDTLQRVLASKRGQFYHEQPADPPAFIQRMQLEEEASSKLKHHAGSRKWAMRQTPLAVVPVAVPITNTSNTTRLTHYSEAVAAQTISKSTAVHNIKPADTARLTHYYTAMAAFSANKPAVVQHKLEQNEERLKLRFDLEQQLKALTVRAEEAMSHHGIEENAERLIMRYHLNEQVENVAASAEKAVTHHEIGQNIERLKLRYDCNQQPVAAAARSERMQAKANPEPKGAPEKLTASAGLYQDKVSWAKYMKESYDTAMRDKQPQQAPVIVSSYSGAGSSGGMQNRDLPSRSKITGRTATVRLERQFVPVVA
jgi:hypothetical protein